MPLPRLTETTVEYSQETLIEAQIGPFHVWFASNGIFWDLIAFRFGDGRLTTRLLDKTDLAWKDLNEAVKAVPHSRFVDPIPRSEFEKAWDLLTDPYLYPRRVGKLKLDYHLDKDTPLGIIADWLQDHGNEDAAKILRDSLKPKEQQ